VGLDVLSLESSCLDVSRVLKSPPPLTDSGIHPDRLQCHQIGGVFRVGEREGWSGQGTWVHVQRNTYTTMVRRHDGLGVGVSVYRAFALEGLQRQTTHGVWLGCLDSTRVGHYIGLRQCIPLVGFSPVSCQVKFSQPANVKNYQTVIFSFFFKS